MWLRLLLTGIIFEKVRDAIQVNLMKIQLTPTRFVSRHGFSSRYHLVQRLQLYSVSLEIENPAR